MKKSMMLAGLVLLAGCEAPDPEARLQALHLPPQGFVGDPAKGESLYANYCIACHGPEGRGTEQGPPLVDQIYRPGHHANLAFHMAVRDGVRQHHWSFGDMPPVEGISAKQTEHVAAYIRRKQQATGIR